MADGNWTKSFLSILYINQSYWECAVGIAQTNFGNFSQDRVNIGCY